MVFDTRSCPGPTVHIRGAVEQIFNCEAEQARALAPVPLTHMSNEQADHIPVRVGTFHADANLARTAWCATRDFIFEVDPSLHELSKSWPNRPAAAQCTTFLDRCGPKFSRDNPIDLFVADHSDDLVVPCPIPPKVLRREKR
jgi:hypothetical protein